MTRSPLTLSYLTTHSYGVNIYCEGCDTWFERSQRDLTAILEVFGDMPIPVFEKRLRCPNGCKGKVTRIDLSSPDGQQVKGVG